MFVFHEILHPVFLYDAHLQLLKYAFLPLLLISVSAAFQLTICWLYSFHLLLKDEISEATDRENDRVKT